MTGTVKKVVFSFYFSSYNTSMPEIAEVEVSCQALRRLIGKRLDEASIFDDKITADFSDLLGQKLIEIERAGKRIGLVFENNEAIVIHLRMTGRVYLGADDKARLEMRFGSERLSFIDSRRFGTVSVVDREEIASELGPDLFHDWPIEIEKSSSSRPIKNVILDQKFIAGIGNYLADESLWLAQINPKRAASSLDRSEWQELLSAAHQTAEKALAGGGLSMRDYLGPDGQAGTMGLSLACYGRSGEECLRCSKRLVKIKLSGRGTTYCPHCQAD